MPKNLTPKKLLPSLDKSEIKRLLNLRMHEETARQNGFKVIGGVDEAGRGPLAGPVVAAACIIPEDLLIPGINDSKQLTPKQRCELYDRIVSEPRIVYGVGVVDHKEIDEINILQATKKAMRQAVAQLEVIPDYLLVDGLDLNHETIPCQKIFQGDANAYCIAAASIIAKEGRDRMMLEYHKQYPEYGFDKHKGYGTELHLQNLAKHGPCPIHRLTFAPLKQVDSCLKDSNLLSLS